MEIGDLIGRIRETVSVVPSPLLAIAILATPTLVWLAYRWFWGVTSSRNEPLPSAEGFWVCPACASLTPEPQDRCYRCRMERPEVVAVPTDAGLGVPVMDLRPGIPVMDPELSRRAEEPTRVSVLGRGEESGRRTGWDA